MDSSMNIIDLEYLRNPIYSTSKMSLKGAPLKKEDLRFYKIRIYQMTKDLVLEGHINDKINAAFNNYARTCIQHFKFIDMRDLIQEDCECEGTQESIIYELSSESMFIYPNPSQSYITVDLGHLEVSTATLKIYDYSGKQVYDNQASTRTIVDISDFTKGLYTLVVFNSKKVLRGKVLVD